jgi:hypothetical protein
MPEFYLNNLSDGKSSRLYKKIVDDKKDGLANWCALAIIKKIMECTFLWFTASPKHVWKIYLLKLMQKSWNYRQNYTSDKELQKLQNK